LVDSDIRISSCGNLTGIQRFEYTAFKNDRQNERHPGFSGFSLAIPGSDKYIYVNMHVDTQDFARVNVQNHTMVIAITSKTGDLEFEMSCKANFGGSGADFKVTPDTGVPFLPVGNPATQKLLTDLYDPKLRYFERKINRKRINLLNKENPDPLLRYEGKTVEDRSRGVYEGWFGGGEAFCMHAADAFVTNGIEVDVKDSHNGCHDQGCTTKVVLGSEPNQYTKYFMPNKGMNREITFRNISIGASYCTFKIPSRAQDGVFYTDQYCKEVYDGPGKNRVRQVMKPSFTGVTISDSFAVSDVHGHSYYEISRPGGVDQKEDEKKGLFGFQQVAASVGINVSDK
jgi:hypothetical protein